MAQIRWKGIVGEGKRLQQGTGACSKQSMRPALKGRMMWWESIWLLESDLGLNPGLVSCWFFTVGKGLYFSNPVSPICGMRVGPYSAGQ